jgi:hypothetical protein
MDFINREILPYINEQNDLSDIRVQMKHIARWHNEKWLVWRLGVVMQPLYIIYK